MTSALTAPKAQRRSVVRLEAEGRWCPMAHCNRLDDSCHDLTPLRAPASVQRVMDPRVSNFGFIHLGSFTGQSMAVCTYASPRRPALAAYDYESGEVLWVSPIEDLQGFPKRIPAGVLIARMARGAERAATYVFAANPAEFVAYNSDGRRLWKRRTSDVTGGHELGIPISISYTDAGELIAATSRGWIVKLDPVDGRTIHVHRLRGVADVDGRLYEGTFGTLKSPIVVGDVMYILAEFRPSREFLPVVMRPVYILRVQLSAGNGEPRLIQPLSHPRRVRSSCPDRAFVGVARGRGSPSAMIGADGRVLIFAHAHVMSKGRLWPVIACIEDDRGVLSRRWISRMDVIEGDSVHSAPALHAASRTLLVNTYTRMFAFRGIDGLIGNVEAPAPLDAVDLFDRAASAAVRRVGFGSPFALARAERNELIAYTNFRAFVGRRMPYGHLGAFAVPLRGGRPRALWSRPLGFTDEGVQVPSPGTFGQPALFRYEGSRGPATGVIVNTVYTGTYIIR